MCEAWGNGATWVHDENVQPHEARYLKLDISKARAGLRWTPRWSLAQALESIVAWHRAWLAGADMHQYCNTELERFVAAPLNQAA